MIKKKLNAVLKPSVKSYFENRTYYLELLVFGNHKTKVYTVGQTHTKITTINNQIQWQLHNNGNRCPASRGRHSENYE